MHLITNNNNIPIIFVIPGASTCLQTLLPPYAYNSLFFHRDPTYLYPSIRNSAQNTYATYPELLIVLTCVQVQISLPFSLSRYI